MAMALSMRLGIGKLYVRLGSKPIEENNYFSIRCDSSSCSLRAAAFAEEFDRGLTFYVELCEALRDLTECCWFELRKLRKKRLPQFIANSVAIKGYTHCGGLYGGVLVRDLSPLLNEFWLGGTFRILGTTEIPAAGAIEVANALDDRKLQENGELPSNLVLISEKQYRYGEPYMQVLFDKTCLNSVRGAITRVAAGLRHPLIEVGAAYFEAVTK